MRLLKGQAMTRKKDLKNLGKILLALFVLYLIVGNLVFKLQLEHPRTVKLQLHGTRTNFSEGKSMSSCEAGASQLYHSKLELETRDS